MSVLSDTTIRDRLSSLVPNGQASDANHCAYEFTAEKVFKGSAAEPLLVSDSKPVVVAPTELVWVRAKEQISVPNNCVGLWVQTQTLSRKGMLLLNHTLVEPGYRGPLHAVFVNFGKAKVTISPVTKIAKVVFFELDKGAENLVRFDTSAYDNSILEISANSPDSFMHLSSLAPSLKTEADDLLRNLRAEADKLQAETTTSAKAVVTAEFEKQKSEMKDDIKTAALRWGGGAVVGLLLGVAAVWFGLSMYLPRIAAAYADVDGIARRAVQERAASLDAASAELRANRAELDVLRKELQALKEQNTNLEKRIGNVPSQRTSQ